MNEADELNPFDANACEYDLWYERNNAIYKSELSALSYLIKKAKNEYSRKQHIITKDISGLEIGVGSGRFGSALGIGTGIDPSENMLKIASGRGMKVIQGVGEELPFEAETFDYTAFFTSVCFLDDPEKAFLEANRVTKNNGFLICSFLNRKSEMGKQLYENKSDDFYFKNASFYDCGEITELLTKAGYNNYKMTETIFTPATNIQKHINGINKGLYGIILAWKI